MKVCVLSGSPKGKNSITYQTVLYLEQRFPKCEFETLHVGQRIRQYEKDMSEAAQISTSKHFYDTTAHAFIEENCRDLGLRYVGGLSADMEDLLTEKGRKEAVAFPA